MKTRQNDSSKRRVLDNATRLRRKQRQLEQLEKDNVQEDPHAAWQHLAAKTKLPVFSDGLESKAVNHSPILYSFSNFVFFLQFCILSPFFHHGEY